MRFKNIGVFTLIFSLVLSNPSFAQEIYATRIEQDAVSSLSVLFRGEPHYEYWLEIREVQEGIVVYKCHEGEECEPLVNEVVTLEELRSALVKHNVTYTLVALVGLAILVFLAKQAGVVGATGVAASTGLGGAAGGGLWGTLIVGPASGGMAGGILMGVWSTARAYTIFSRASAAGTKLSWIEKAVVMPFSVLGSIVMGAALGNSAELVIDQFKSGRQLPAGYAIADGPHLRKLLSDKTNLYTFDLYKLEVELARLINVIVKNRQE